MIQKTLLFAMGVMVFTFAGADSIQALAQEGENVAPAPSSRQAMRAAKKKTKGTFEPASYLTELSAEGAHRGYKEFSYKQTPQGELRIYFKTPGN